eukprot:12905439-Prorocentrum_lima.AAC.1
MAQPTHAQPAASSGSAMEVDEGWTAVPELNMPPPPPPLGTAFPAHVPSAGVQGADPAARANLSVGYQWDECKQR